MRRRQNFGRKPRKSPTPESVEGSSSSSTTNRQPKARPRTGRAEETLELLTNHFTVSVHPKNTDAYFYQYDVSLTYENGDLVNAKDIGRKVMDKALETHRTKLEGVHLAYDGDKSLFTSKSFPEPKFELKVGLEDASSNRGSTAGNVGDGSDRKGSGRPDRSKTIIVNINFAKKISMDSIVKAARGDPSEDSQNAVRVLDIILRQNAAKKGRLIVGQSFFDTSDERNRDKSAVDVYQGFNSSFRATQGGLFLNMDVSHTLIIRPGSVISFLLCNQNIEDGNIKAIDWNKAKRMLKNLRVQISDANEERKIRGLSERSCKDQTFEIKQRNEGPDGGEFRSVKEISVYNYFSEHRKKRLGISIDLPCIDVGKSKHPVYIPVELCSLVNFQRYTKALSTEQRSSLVEKSRLNPKVRKEALEKAIQSNAYNKIPMLSDSGISITTQFTKVGARILPAPTLTLGDGQDLSPRNGMWNLNNKKLAEPTTVGRWLVASFSSDYDMEGLIKLLINCAKKKGISMKYPAARFTENPVYKHKPAPERVDKLLSDIKSSELHRPNFILCILPQKKNCDIYGPWKRGCLSDYGVPTQCIVPTRVDDHYLTNVLLKINAKLEGLNSLLSMENCSFLGSVSSKPTLILGMDVSHGPPGQADMPSIAAVVNSRRWPSICRYRASVRTQSPRSEMIDSLFERQPDSTDSGIIRGALMDFYTTSGSMKPEQIIIFRDGVGESQFNQVLEKELTQIIEACKLYDKKWKPKFMVIVAQKRHHTRFFKEEYKSFKNVPPGTIVDKIICHPRNEDFYLCAHDGKIGTSRPTHYHVLQDDIGFEADDLQKLVHSLCYAYQRSTRVVSLVAPICYAHLAAAQVAQMIKPEDYSSGPSSSQAAASSSSQAAAAAAAPIPKLPPFHEAVADTMFFC